MIKNLKRNWLGVLKLTKGIWRILTNFNGLLLIKVYNLWAKKRSYLLWHWRVMQNLKRNWLVSSKLTWGNLTNFDPRSGKSKILHFNELLLTKYIVCELKRYRGVMLEWCYVRLSYALKNDAKFEEKLTCDFKNDMKNLGNFLTGWKIAI